MKISVSHLISGQHRQWSDRRRSCGPDRNLSRGNACGL